LADLDTGEFGKVTATLLFKRSQRTYDRPESCPVWHSQSREGLHKQPGTNMLRHDL